MLKGKSDEGHNDEKDEDCFVFSECFIIVLVVGCSNKMLEKTGGHHD